MAIIDTLFQNNREWSAEIKRQDPDFFEKLSRQQNPKFLWIGCADSRVPANQIVGMLPGELFVHRNVANVVVHTDFNCLSVLQYAVEVLQVEHVIVCGHYGCGGVAASLEEQEHGLIDNWLQHIRDVYNRHQHLFEGITDDHVRIDRLCELNVMAQVANVCHTTIVQSAWRQGRKLSIHGFIYSIRNGELTNLRTRIDGLDHVARLGDIIEERFSGAAS